MERSFLGICIPKNKSMELEIRYKRCRSEFARGHSARHGQAQRAPPALSSNETAPPSAAFDSANGHSPMHVSAVQTVPGGHLHHLRRIPC